MTIRLQVILTCISILVFLMVLRFIKKSKVSTQSAVIWILWSFGLIIISVFPKIISQITAFFGIQSSINGLFLIMIFLLYMLVFFLYLKISVLENKVRDLTQHIAIREKEENDVPASR